ncbi:MAG: RelA/SpoT family protein [Elusimicrobiales bacterium]|nr:RelA/SpoT family protein [Elusimicrobiales bacterium]
MMQLEDLLSRFREYSQQDTTLLEYAWHYAQEAHKGQLRKSGDEYFTHCAAVAEILISFKMDIPTICAGLLHDVIEDTDIPHDTFRKEFGDEIFGIVSGVTKIDSINFSSKDLAQIENWRKMVLAMAEDIRVIIVKLADRLHNMRTLQFQTPEKQQKKAQETLSLYAPLAQRLGIFSIKSELEDLSFKYLQPKEYYELLEKVQQRYARREQLLDEFKDALNKHLEDTKIPHRVLSRAKNLYSIYRKMQMQNKPFEEIQDTLAARIITDSILNCYALLGLVHSLFKPVSGTFTDYIAVPKMNGYQSLHTTVVASSGEMVEIQIRTEKMHYTNEYGIAAHWRYKLGEKSPDEHLNEKLNWLREWIEKQQNLNNDEFMDGFKGDLEMQQIFVFTPKGKVKPLVLGSTPLDFAYSIHTEVGNTCIGARVNGKMAKLDKPLKSGDICEILTKKNSTPKKDWLKIVKTATARSSIRRWLRENGESEE